MAYAGSYKLEERLGRIEAQRRKIAKGAVYSVNQDGLIIAKPRRRGLRFPVRILAFAAASVILFKAVVYAAIGPASYTDRVSSLTDGTAVERFAAWVMTADSATIWLATQLRLLVS